MSQDVFQMRMDQILEKCPGVIGIHDDVVIYGKTREEHDANLVNFLNVCQEEGLVLNGKKLELQKEQVTFFGALFSKEGMRPDPKKLQGIEDLTPPADKQAVTVISGHGDIHGRIHTPSEPSHTAAESSFEERCRVLLGQSD